MNIKLIGVAIFFLWSMLACQHPENAHDLAPDEFSDLMAKTPQKIILDVRTNEEVARGIIKGAIQLDFMAPDFEQSLQKLDKTKPIFVYCAVGGRSGQTVELMQQLGFQEVYNLQGGLDAWQHAGLPIAQWR
jgi:rhodanese-related sulfurtransferase